MVTGKHLVIEQRLMVVLAGLVAVVSLVATTFRLILVQLATGTWPHGAPIPLSSDWTVTLPLVVTSRWWDVLLAPLLAIYLVWITSWMLRASRRLLAVGFISLGLPLIGTIMTLAVDGQSSLLEITLLYLVPLTVILGGGAGFEHGRCCLHDAFVALLVGGVPASCLPGAVSFGLLPGLLVAVPIFLTFFVSLTAGIIVGATLSAPFRSFEHWLHPAAH